MPLTEAEKVERKRLARRKSYYKRHEYNCKAKAEYYVKNKEVIKQTIREYRKNNPEKDKITRKSSYDRRREAILLKRLEYRERYPEQILWASAKRRAKQKNLEFLISVSDIKIPKFCPMLGIELKTIRYKGTYRGSPSLDRIDSSKGYVPGNVWVISHMANTMKCNATFEELLLFAQSIQNNFGNKKCP